MEICEYCGYECEAMSADEACCYCEEVIGRSWKSATNGVDMELLCDLCQQRYEKRLKNEAI